MQRATRSLLKPLFARQQYHPIGNARAETVDQTSHGDSAGIELDNAHAVKDSSALHAEPPPPNSRLFSSTQQTWRLFFPQFIRWIITVIIVIFMLATLKLYENKGNFSLGQKHAFNTIITALSLGLGLNFFEAFKGIAKVLRWTILASSSHSVRELDLILSIESLSKVVELACESRRRALTVLICFLWL